MAKENEKKKDNFFMRLFKGSASKIAFFRNKESVAEFMEKEKIKAEVLIEAAQKMMREKRGTIDDTIAEYKGDDRDVYLYDFINEYRNGFGSGGNFVIAGRSVGGVAGANADFDGDSDIALSASDSGETVNGNITLAVSDIEKLPKKRYKPKEVFGELERTPSKVDLEDLENKILILKMKEKFIRKNEYAKKEVIDMVTRLENRKKYEEHKTFFEKFDNTTTQKINDLINKYELVLKPSDLFIPSFPDEAIKTMNDYTETVQKICGKKPVYYVIAESEKFKEESERNDPILLVQSPFGIYWQILGAWDEELVLLSEL